MATAEASEHSQSEEQTATEERVPARSFALMTLISAI